MTSRPDRERSRQNRKATAGQANKANDITKPYTGLRGTTSFAVKT